MTPEAIAKLLYSHLPDCRFTVEIDGNHCLVTAIGETFVGKKAVQRQQLIYRALKDPITEGNIHAVHMKIYTPDEWIEKA